MDELIRHNSTSTFGLEFININLDLAQINSLTAFENAWDNEIAELLPHDYAIFGEAKVESGGIKITKVVLQRGQVYEAPGPLLARCASLIATWNIMRQACLMNLGPCSCIGQRLLGVPSEVSRSFLIHGKVDNNDINKIIFIMLSSLGWSDEAAAKHFINNLIDPFASAINQHLSDDNSVLLPEADSDNHFSRLTTREVDIINWLVKGKTNKEIARDLGTSPYTVRNQIARLAQKVGARNRAQLVSLIALKR